MTDPQTLISQRIVQAVAAAFGPDLSEIDPLVSPSRNPQFGDYQANVAMPLAKQTRRKPQEVAAAIIGNLQFDDVADPPTVAGPGFINFKLKAEYLAALAAELLHDDHLGVAKDGLPATGGHNPKLRSLCS